MEVFGELENNTQAQKVEKNPTTLFKATLIAAQDQNDNSSDSEDDYDMHQSKLDAEQFELRDEVDAGKQTSKLMSAIQKVKERMRLQQQMQENESKSQIPNVMQNVTQPITQTTTNAATQKITQTGTFEDDGYSMGRVESNANIQSTQLVSSSSASVNNNPESDDDDDDDDIVKPTQKMTAIVDSDDAESETEQPVSNRKSKIILPDDDDDDDDDDKIMPPLRNRPTFNTTVDANNIGGDDADNDDLPIQPSANLVSLFVSEDEETEFEAENEYDEISARIENYATMSKEQRYLARKLERSKIREEKRNELVTKSQIISKPFVREITPRADTIKEKKFERNLKKERLRTHTMLKKANEDIQIVTEHEYSKDKLLERLKFDSDSEDENASTMQNSIAPSTAGTHYSVSPPSKHSIKPVRVLIKDRQIVKTQTEVIEFSESDDSDKFDDTDNIADVSIIEKTKKLDLSLKYSKKKKSRIVKIQKLSFSDKIQKLKAKELKDKLSTNIIESKVSKTTYTDAELAKMLLQDQMNNSVREKKKRREQKRLERQQRLLKEGKLTHDDEDPEYSSDYDISDESEDYGSGDDDGDDGDDDSKYKQREKDDEGGEEVKQSAAGLFDTSGKLGEFNFTLSNMDEKAKSQDAEYDALTSAEKFKKMKQVIEVESQTQPNNSITDQDTYKSALISNITLESNSILESQNFQLNDLLDSQNLVLETQADDMAVSTQKLDNDSGMSISTQKVESFMSVGTTVREGSVTSEQTTQLVGNIEEEYDDDDEKIQIGRRIKIEESKSDKEELEELEEPEETEEERHMRAQLIKKAKKQEREEIRKREAEFRAKGLGDILEKEAVESEDEFQGVGGGDHDFSDEENSEDEKMIDDAINGSIGEDEIRKLHLNKELEEDQARVAKTYKDVKTHELGKRRAKNGIFDVSDSEDDEMDEQRRMIEFIRKRRLKERQELMARNEFKLDENDPKKAFYDEVNIKLPSHISIYKDSYTNSISDFENNNDDDAGQNEDIKNYYNNVDSFKRPALKRRKTSTIQSFEDDDDFKYSSFHDQEAERLKAEVLSDSTDDDDHDGSKMLKQLKKKTSIKLTRKLGVPKPKAKENIADMGDQNTFSLLTKSNSVTSSFKKSTEKKVKISANTGNVIREVTVTTNSKSITNSKAAVTGLSSSSSIDDGSKKKAVRGSGLDRLEKMLAKSRQKGIRTIGKR